MHAILDELSIGGFFSAITSAEDVTRGKPDPQVYLTAALRVNVLPNRCIVIEDAPAGVEGAKRANMRSIGVLTDDGLWHSQPGGFEPHKREVLVHAHFESPRRIEDRDSARGERVQPIHSEDDLFE